MLCSFSLKTVCEGSFHLILQNERIGWFGLKQAENEPKTNHVSDLHLSLCENDRFQKRAYSACFQAEYDRYKNSGTVICYSKHAYRNLWSALQRHNIENLKQIFPEKQLCGLSPNFHHHVSVSDLYIYSHDWSAYPAPAAGKYVGQSWEYNTNRSQTHECGNWDYNSGNTKMGFSLQCMSSYTLVPH